MGFGLSDHFEASLVDVDDNPFCSSREVSLYALKWACPAQVLEFMLNRSLLLQFAWPATQLPSHLVWWLKSKAVEPPSLLNTI